MDLVIYLPWMIITTEPRLLVTSTPDRFDPSHALRPQISLTLVTSNPVNKSSTTLTRLPRNWEISAIAIAVFPRSHMRSCTQSSILQKGDLFAISILCSSTEWLWLVYLMIFVHKCETWPVYIGVVSEPPVCSCRVNLVCGCGNLSHSCVQICVLSSVSVTVYACAFDHIACT